MNKPIALALVASAAFRCAVEDKDQNASAPIPAPETFEASQDALALCNVLITREGIRREISDRGFSAYCYGTVRSSLDLDPTTSVTCVDNAYARDMSSGGDFDQKAEECYRRSADDIARTPGALHTLEAIEVATRTDDGSLIAMDVWTQDPQTGKRNRYRDPPDPDGLVDAAKKVGGGKTLTRFFSGLLYNEDCVSESPDGIYLMGDEVTCDPHEADRMIPSRGALQHNFNAAIRRAARILNVPAQDRFNRSR